MLCCWPRHICLLANAGDLELERMVSESPEPLALTDLSELAAEVLNLSASQSLPVNLPDHWLRRIARDLDACANEDEDDPEPSVYMAGPLAIVLRLLLGKNSESPGVVTFDQLERYFRELRLEVHLELISRFTNIAVDAAGLDSIFEGRSVNVTLPPERQPPKDSSATGEL